VGRKRNITGSNGSVAHANGSARPRRAREVSREAFRPLRLRGRRELVTAMVDALNDILQSERTLY
jgi:hypothetical protein